MGQSSAKNRGLITQEIFIWRLGWYLPDSEGIQQTFDFISNRLLSWSGKIHFWPKETSWKIYVFCFPLRGNCYSLKCIAFKFQRIYALKFFYGCWINCCFNFRYDYESIIISIQKSCHCTINYFYLSLCNNLGRLYCIQYLIFKIISSILELALVDVLS